MSTKKYVNIITKIEYDNLPTILENTINPSFDLLFKAGYREILEEDEVPDGCRPLEFTYTEIDGIRYCKKVLVSYINIEEERIQKEQELIQAEINRQSSKSLSLKRIENTFLTICDQLTNTSNHTKLGFQDLENIITNMEDKQLASTIAISLLKINAEGVREGGVKWWDDCIWHSEIL